MNLNFETDGVNFNNKGKPDEITTPQHICDDMSSLFDFTDCNRKIWVDIYCKTGNTLEPLKKHGVNKENIIAICDNKQSQMLICRKLYGKILPEIDCSTEINTITRRGQVYYIAKYKDIVKNRLDKYIVDIFKTIKEQYMLEFKPEDDFKINNIIMNPPYNNDMYIDFVTLAHKVASDNVVAITPAKFQAKGGDKNEQFRNDIVPYMGKITYYPYCTDIFDIVCQGGVCYYILTKHKHNIKELTTKCSVIKYFETNGVENTDIGYILYNNTVRKIINKIRTDNHLECKNDVSHKYIVGITNVYSEKELCDKKGQANVLIEPYIQCGIQKKNSDTSFLDSFDTEEEALNYISYLNTKTVRFGFLIAKTSQHMQSSFSWQYVPDPGKFDKIFEDKSLPGYTPDENGLYTDNNGKLHCSLYVKYKLTEEEIELIESVIKERK